MEFSELKNIIEALVFASESPLKLNQLAEILPECSADDIKHAVTELQQDMDNRVVTIKRVAGGYQFATRPEYAQYISKLFETRDNNRLTRASLEALAVVAFKQPISKVEVSAIRGVNSDGVIKKLLDRKLITISGRDDGPGRALLFKTTDEFLNYFGINDVKDLPRPKEVEDLLAEGEGGKLLQELPEEVLIAEGIQTEEEGEQGRQQEGEQNADQELEHAESSEIKKEQISENDTVENDIDVDSTNDSTQEKGASYDEAK